MTTDQRRILIAAVITAFILGATLPWDLLPWVVTP